MPGFEALPRTVLIVDDDVSFREVTAEYLTMHGCAVVHAGNGLEALRQVARARPEAILLDLTMPRLNGFETLKRIAALDPTLRVVVVTGDADPATHRRMLARGADAVLLKPINFRQLLATLGGQPLA